jgi:hypothetical protein
MYASFEKIYHTDGTVWMYAVAHGALTAKTPYKIIAGQNGPATAALADDDTYHYVGVPEVDWDSGDVAKLQIGGPIEDMITPSLSVTAGHALSVTDGAVADAAANYSGAKGEFAVCTATSTTSETQDAILVPERILTNNAT